MAAAKALDTQCLIGLFPKMPAIAFKSTEPCKSIMDYDTMLKRAYVSLPERTQSKERFEMPLLDSSVQGKRTIVKNFGQAMKAVSRDERQLYKYITKETATSGTIEEGKLILSGKFFPDLINKLFTNYLKEYVLCHTCGKPDTQIIDKSGIKVLKCTACGAISPLKKLG